MLGRIKGGTVVRGEPWEVLGRRFTPIARVRRFARRFGEGPQAAGAFAFVSVTPVGVEEETADGTRLVATPDVTGQALRGMTHGLLGAVVGILAVGFLLRRKSVIRDTCYMRYGVTHHESRSTFHSSFRR
jgi:hypothetical protein